MAKYITPAKKTTSPTEQAIDLIDELGPIMMGITIASQGQPHNAALVNATMSLNQIRVLLSNLQ